MKDVHPEIESEAVFFSDCGAVRFVVTVHQMDHRGSSEILKVISDFEESSMLRERALIAGDMMVSRQSAAEAIRISEMSFRKGSRYKLK